MAGLCARKPIKMANGIIRPQTRRQWQQINFKGLRLGLELYLVDFVWTFGPGTEVKSSKCVLFLTFLETGILTG